jgi:ribosomal protein S8
VQIRAKPTKLVLAVAQILYEERLIRGYRRKRIASQFTQSAYLALADNEAEMEVYLRYSMAGRPIIRDIKMITTPGKKAIPVTKPLSNSVPNFCVFPGVLEADRG